MRTRSGRYPVREYTQRVAIVSREDVAGAPGFWVELKTIDPARGTRIERGLFAAVAPPAAGDSTSLLGGGGSPEAGPLDPGTPLHLVRYQVLNPAGKLYEYPLQSASAPRADGMVSSYELFEFDPSVRPERAFLGPDTLRIGRRVVPAVVERLVRLGSDDWPTFEDSTSVYRLKMTQLFWRNAAVPITGFAKSLFRVTTVKMAAHPDSIREEQFVPPDSVAGASPGTAPGGPPAAGLSAADTTLAGTTPADTSRAGAATTPAGSSRTGAAPTDTSLAEAAPADSSETGDEGAGRILAWTELTLQDLGADAVPEVTQEPEPAPAEELQKHQGFAR